MASILVCCIRGLVQRVPGSVATWISTKYIGIHKQYIGIVFSSWKTNSVRRNGLIKIAQQGAIAFLCGRDKPQLKNLMDATDQAGQPWNELYVHMHGKSIGREIFAKLECNYNDNLFIIFVENPN